MFGNFEEYEKTHYSLGDWLCSVHLPYICEEEPRIASPNETHSLEGYELIPHLGYYKLHDTPQSWEDAVDTCDKEGGHLIVLSSLDEQDALWNYLKETVSYLFCFWIGVHDRYEEGKYTTIFSKYPERSGMHKSSCQRVYQP